MKKCYLFFFSIISLFAVGCFQALAATDSTNTKVHLYFYTVDGESIEELTKTIDVNSPYMFKDPDLYKYLVYIGGDGKRYTNENSDKVKGLYWEEETEFSASGKKYYFGDRSTFPAGDHSFRVKTDNPVLTGENTLYLGNGEKVHLAFYTAEYEEQIESLSCEISCEDEFVFPDPKVYATPGGGSAYEGTYWRCADENDNVYLFRAGERAKFRPGYYDLRVVTNEPVTIRYRYPMDIGSLFEEHNPGDLYATVTAYVGDRIQLKRSLGAIAWGYDFVEWEEYNYDFGTYKAGATFQVTDNEDLCFVAVYEEKEDWDPNAIDENRSEEDITNHSEDYVVSAEQVNAAAGTGYGAYIDDDGKLRRKNTGRRINGSTYVTGVPGEISQSSDLTTLKPGEPKDAPSSYTKDKYGREAEASNIIDKINGVLKQDDSALYMDIFGNSMIYHSNLGRVEDLCIAYLRLRNKNDSFAAMVSGWDQTAIERFEAIEFALLCDEYPGKSTSAYQRFNSNDATVLRIKAIGGLTANDKLPEWKNEYMSEKVFNELSSYKKVWSGWLDNYTDGLEELYKGTQNGTRVVGSIGDKSSEFLASLGNVIRDSICLTAYAAENQNGISFQYGARLNLSMDVEGVIFTPQYFDPNMLYSFESYGFSTLTGLSGDQITSLQTIFNFLVNDMGFSKEMAAGACGNIWQESNFTASYSDSNGAIGIAQWSGNRKAGLMAAATNSGKDWKNLDLQLDFMASELKNQGFLKRMNEFLARYGNGTSAGTIKDTQIACDAWCAAFEGCVCKTGSSLNNGFHSSHGGSCAVCANGVSYQELGSRRKNARAIYNALVVYSEFGDGGSFAGMSNSDILMTLFGYPSKSEVQAHFTLSQLKSMCVDVRLSDGRYITVHKAIAQDVAAALNALIASGFKVDNTTYGWRSSANTSGGGYSFHNLGLAIDINCGSSSSKSLGWAHNPQFYIKQVSNDQIKANYDPKKDPLAIGVKQAAILSNYGLKWGRDFSSRPDIMHFSVGEVGTEGKNSWISNLVEGANR